MTCSRAQAKKQTSIQQERCPRLRTTPLKLQPNQRFSHRRQELSTYITQPSKQHNDLTDSRMVGLHATLQATRILSDLSVFGPAKSMFGVAYFSALLQQPSKLTANVLRQVRLSSVSFFLNANRMHSAQVQFAFSVGNKLEEAGISSFFLKQWILRSTEYTLI